MSQVELEMTEAQIELIINANTEILSANRTLEALTKGIVAGTKYAREDYKVKSIDQGKKTITIEITDKPVDESAKPSLKVEK